MAGKQTASKRRLSQVMLCSEIAMLMTALIVAESDSQQLQQSASSSLRLVQISPAPSACTITELTVTHQAEMPTVAADVKLTTGAWFARFKLFRIHQ